MNKFENSKYSIWIVWGYILSIKEIAPSMASQIDSKERVWDI